MKLAEIVTFIIAVNLVVDVFVLFVQNDFGAKKKICHAKINVG